MFMVTVRKFCSFSFVVNIFRKHSVAANPNHNYNHNILYIVSGVHLNVSK
jgi:hypothetical protein